MNELQQQIEWLRTELAAAQNAAANRQDFLRLVQIKNRADHIASLVAD